MKMACTQQHFSQGVKGYDLIEKQKDQPWSFIQQQRGNGGCRSYASKTETVVGCKTAAQAK